MPANSVCHPDGTNLYLLGSRLTTPTEDGSVKDIGCGNQVLEIKLTTPLDDGSSNDGSGTGTQKGMLVNKDYVFQITKYRSGKPDNLSSIKWTISYTSPATSLNKAMVLPCNDRNQSENADSLTLNIVHLFKDAGSDMCGCEVIVSAFIDDPTTAAKSTQFVHNRFRWFDAKKFSHQIEQRVKDPWRIDQGYSSLCGMAALFYVMALKHSDKYRTFSIELHRTGIYVTDTKYLICPSSSMYDVRPTDQKLTAMRMWDSDWIVLAGTRSSESNWGYDGIESGSISQAQAINWPGMVSDLLQNLADFPSSIDQTSSIFSYGTKKTIQMLVDMDSKFQDGGHQFLLEIEPDLLTGESTWLTTQRHWIVYAGGLEFFTPKGGWTATISSTDYSTVTYIKMKIFTWGRNPETFQFYLVNNENINPDNKSIQIKDGISFDSFESGFHGYIDAS